MKRFLCYIGRSRIRTSCYVSTWSDPWWCQGISFDIDLIYSYHVYLNYIGAWSVYYSSMRWCLYKSWFKNCDIWCTTTGGLFRIISINSFYCLYIDFNQRFSNSRCWCCGIFSSIWSSYFYYQCWRCTKKYTITCGY